MAFVSSDNDNSFGRSSCFELAVVLNGKGDFWRGCSQSDLRLHLLCQLGCYGPGNFVVLAFKKARVANPTLGCSKQPKMRSRSLKDVTWVRVSVYPLFSL